MASVAPATIGFNGNDDPEVIKAKKRKKVDAARVIQHVFSTILPGEAAVALRIVLEREGYEFTEESTIRQHPFTGSPMEEPFQRHQVVLDGIEQTIPWGTYHVDGLGRLRVDMQTHSMPPKAFLAFQPEKGVDPKKLEEIARKVEAEGKILKLFRGRALKLDSPMDLLIPNPIDTTKAAEMVFNPEIEESLNINLFAPIEHRELFKVKGMRLRRGIILEGPYGVGKTLTAYAAARKALANGWTFFLADNSIAGIGIKVARSMQPAVLFIEDMDAGSHGDRDHLNDLLNSMSGVDAKNDIETIMILSTNFIDRIDPAFLRPERIDAIIEVRPPVGNTVNRLVTAMIGKDLSKDQMWEDLMCEANGATPAILGEAVERAKIKAITSQEPLTVFSVRRMLKQLARQRELATPKFNEDTVPMKLAENLNKVSRGHY